MLGRVSGLYILTIGFCYFPFFPLFLLLENFFDCSGMVVFMRTSKFFKMFISKHASRCFCMSFASLSVGLNVACVLKREKYQIPHVYLYYGIKDYLYYTVMAILLF